MSKISVTTIAGLTSGGDANTVKIESGDTLAVQSNATVGGTLGVTGASTLTGDTQVTGNLGVGVAPERKFHVEGSGAEFSLVDTSRPTDKKTINMFIDANGKGNIRMMNDAQNAGNAAIVIEGSSPHTAPVVTLPQQPMFVAKDTRSGVNSTSEAHANISRHFNAPSSANRGNCFASVGETNAGRFTAPVDGLYHFGWNLFTVSRSADLSTRVGINLNGTTEWSGGDRIGHANQGSCLVEMSANDYVTLGSQGGAYTIYWYSSNQHSRFWGYLVG